MSPIFLHFSLLFIPCFCKIESKFQPDLTELSSEIVDPGQELLDFLRRHQQHLDTPIVDEELLCNCTYKNCDLELVRLNRNLRGLCRSKGGACKKQVSRVNHNSHTEIHLSCVHPDELQPIDRPLICEPIIVVMENTNVACCANQSFCNEKLTVELKPDGWYESVAAKMSESVKMPAEIAGWQLALGITVLLALITFSLTLVLVYILYRNCRLTKVACPVDVEFV